MTKVLANIIGWKNCYPVFGMKVDICCHHVKKGMGVSSGRFFMYIDMTPQKLGHRKAFHPRIQTENCRSLGFRVRVHGFIMRVFRPSNLRS